MNIEIVNYIFATKEELDGYFNKVAGRNKIHVFWRNLLIEMPKDIYFEIKTKPTELKKQKNSQKVSGAAEYKFETEESSKELKEYLNQFSVFVERA